jgi:dTDP-4-amino-4,6-dideoxygalactose transaminase
MQAIHELSQRYGFKIIEDASHAIGGKYKGEPIGNCRYSDITVFSFHPVKIITTAEGGMALTNSDELAAKMVLLRSHGITRDPEQMTHAPDGPWYYQQIDLGFNYRMTELQAALGLSQMRRLDSFVNKRHLIAQRYDKELSGLPIVTPWQHPDSYSSYHLYPIRIKQGKCNRTQRQIYDSLQDAGINVNLHYIPVYRQPYYEAMGFKAGYCPASEDYRKDTLSIPMYPTLTESEQGTVIRVLHEVFK